MEMARKGRERREAKAFDPKPRVAGEPKFRLGPVGPEEPYEALDLTVAPERPGFFKKLLSKLTEGRDYSRLSLVRRSMRRSWERPRSYWRRLRKHFQGRAGNRSCCLRSVRATRRRWPSG